MIQRYRRYLILILVVLALAIFVAIPHKNPVLGRKIETRLGLDLVGGVQALLQAGIPNVTDEQMETALRIVENRVNGLGVSEAVVQRAGQDRIVVELPGEKNPEQAVEVLRQQGLLEFVDFTGVPPATISGYLQSGEEISTDFAQQNAANGTAPTPEASTAITSTQTVTGTAGTENKPVYHTVMTGAALKDVFVEAGTLNNIYISFELKPGDEGTNIFRDHTQTHIGEILAIVLDKKVISTPQIEGAIPDGRGQISGSFTREEANLLANNLRYGSLPIPLNIIQQQTIGPTLGKESLNKSLVAGAIGFAVVILFMGLYYRLPGLVADLAIIIYALIAYALFRSVPVTLTLPGIAGFLLSTGSALDANILIFERLKEELRAGRTLRQAIELGWERAWPSIRDSNAATLITCAILYWFGNAYGATIVKGFSLTLALGVVISLFTAIIMSRTFLNLVVEYLKPKNIVRWFGI